MQTHNQLAKWFTRLYARTINFSGVSREELYQAHGEKRTVFWIDAEDWSAAGQCTPFGTILLNENRLSEAPENVRDYVFLHEVGHTKPPALLSLASIVLRVPLVLLAGFGVPVLIGRWLGVALSFPTLGQFTTFTAVTLTTTLLITLPVIAIWWLDEGYAELFAVSKIGAMDYQRRHEEMLEHADRNLLSCAVRWLLYPNPKFVVWLAEKLDR
ncbi:hypothetical protein SAMN04488063_0473 [Halopelagius inordinatus]|uniref:Peptidase M48 domain-containing protein n=1 Tax=Halopelagius inordinatus TaxID=553467 RepID=A0A1I2LWY5_9EURY|nr:hypothetical protein SAMN04488063_0473 [Halopelagius inordinatus]